MQIFNLTKLNQTEREVYLDLVERADRGFNEMTVSKFTGFGNRRPSGVRKFNAAKSLGKKGFVKVNKVWGEFCSRHAKIEIIK